MHGPGYCIEPATKTMTERAKRALRDYQARIGKIVYGRLLDKTVRFEFTFAFHFHEGQRCQS